MFVIAFDATNRYTKGHTVTTGTLPRYIQKANQVLEVLSGCLNGAWTLTQRELGEHLNISQPELSNIIKLLIDNEKVVKGEPIPGVRGRNHVLILKDSTPFEKAVARKQQQKNMQTINSDDIGILVRGLKEMDNSEVHQFGKVIATLLTEASEATLDHARIREEQNARLREYRDMIAIERRMRSELLDQNRELSAKVEQLQNELNALMFRYS